MKSGIQTQIISCQRGSLMPTARWRMTTLRIMFSAEAGVYVQVSWVVWMTHSMRWANELFDQAGILLTPLYGVPLWRCWLHSIFLPREMNKATWSTSRPSSRRDLLSTWFPGSLHTPVTDGSIVSAVLWLFLAVFRPVLIFVQNF
jgi:hypothetical protein